MNTWKKLLSMLLVLAMLLVGPMMTGLSRAVAEGDTTEEPAPGKGRVLETEDLDPADFQIHRERTGEDAPAVTPEEPEEIDPETIVSVMIYLDGKSTIEEGFETKGIAHNTRAVSYRRGLQLQQKTTQTKIEGAIGHELNVEWYLTLLVNAIAAEVAYKDIAAIEAIPGIKAVEIQQELSIPEPIEPEVRTILTSEYMVGAQDAWAAGYNGLNSRIAIIDSGIDPDHISFNEEAFLHAVEEDRANGKEVNLMGKLDDETLSQLNSKIMNPSLTADDLYVSAKIPYGYNYYLKNLQIDHYSTGNSYHGSHVGGIAAANRYLKVGNEFKDALEQVHAVGMAPDAQLIVMNVGAGKGSMGSAECAAALEDSIILGCEVANQSFGISALRFSYGLANYGFDADLYSGLIDSNTIVSASAGNEGAMPDLYDTELYIEDVKINTTSWESTVVHALDVASADNVGSTGLILKIGDHNIFYWESNFDQNGKPYGNPEITTIAGEHEFVYIDGKGSAEEYEEVNAAVSLEGKIVIVNRGELSFFEKGNNAIQFLPKAVLIANNAPGQILMNLTGFTGDFPMVSFSLADANWIKANSTSGETANYTYYTGTITVAPPTDPITELTGERENATVSDFSGWGAPDSLLMKPEITAPGGNIWAPQGTTNYEGGGTDHYIAISGTSMAAPHISGLTAILAQRLRENPIKNDALTAKYNNRAIMQSLLMSTATPMMDGGDYISILQQGAGLVEVGKAVTAPSVVMIDDAYLTTATGAADDGKVKVELGDDPEKTGEYTYTFTIYNTSDVALAYELESKDTKIFTQNVIHLTSEDFGYTAELVGSDSPLLGIDNDFMDRATVAVDSTATYSYGEDDRHDVNKDGMTDADDAQAILDYLTGVVDGATLNLEAGEMDGDGKITSYDAELLLHFAPIEGKLIVPAHGSKQVTVKIKLNDTFEDYPNGAFIEGFTYVKGTAVDAEGVDYTHEHTIPIFGFYGSWEDPSMFDNISSIEADYGSSNRIPYSGYYSNYVSVDYTEWGYPDNPWWYEEEYPADCIAINSNDMIKGVFYNLIRDAGTLGYAVSKTDKFGGEVTEVLESGILGNYEGGQFVNASTGNLTGNDTSKISLNKSPASIGELQEGDTFRVGVYALPELTAMKVNGDMTDGDAGTIRDEEVFAELIKSNTLGKGVFIGQDFTIDNTAPEIGEVTLNDETGEITIEVTDNQNVAYVAILDVNGNITYAEANPGTPQGSVTFDAREAIDEALTYVAVFAGDYAGNCSVKAAKVNNVDYVWETVYVLTDEFTSGEAYSILNSDRVGSAKCINYGNTGFGYRLQVGGATVREGIEETDGLPYITSGASVWNNVDNKLKIAERYLRINVNGSTVALQTSTTDSNNVWAWDAVNHTLSTSVTVGDAEKTYYLGISTSNSIVITETENNLYLYKKFLYKVPVDVDPNKVTALSVDPNDLSLFIGQESKLQVSVLPITADPSVTWESSDPAVATVDENGVVKGITVGEATVTATSVIDPSFRAEVRVVVATVEANDLKGIVWDEDADIYLAEFNSEEPENWEKLHEAALPATDLNGAAKVFNEIGGIDLYLTTFEDPQTASKVYKVDETTYAMTEIEPGDGIPPFDIAEGIEPNRVAFVYGKYAGWINMLPEETEDGSYDSLSHGVLFNFTGDWENVYCIAAEPGAVDLGDPYGVAALYYAIDENGDVYDVMFTTNGYASTPEKVISTGITPSNYDSLYAVPSSDYESTYLYWTHYNEDLNSSEMIVLAIGFTEEGEAFEKGILRDGKNFGDGVWPVVGLYSDMILNEETVGTNKLSSFKESAELVKMGEEGQIAKDKDLTLNVIPKKATESAASEAAEPDPISAVADRTASAVKLGSINRGRSATALVGAETRKAGGSSSTSYPDVTIKLYEDKASTNGFFTVKYDPKKLTYVSEDHITEYGSLHVDKTKGEIKFAYASMNAIAAKKTLATLKFKAQGQDTTVTVTTTERGSNVALNETSTIQVKGQQPKPATVEVKATDVQFNGKTPYRVYNGKAQTPGYIVKDEKGNVIPASKYKAEYKENVKAGTAYIFITFPNKDYKDCRTFFKIYLPATTWTKVENVENGIKISWTKVEGAAGYVVYRRAWNLKDNGWTTFERWNNTTGTSWVDTKVYAGTRYQYGVKAYFARRADAVTGAMIGGNVGDNYNLGLVGPLKTTVRITTRVLNSVTPGSKKLTVKWTGSSLFTGYQVQVATDAKFTKDLKTVTVDKAGTYEKAVTGLKAKTTYYVRVRSYHIFEGMTYYGQWSNVLNGTTK